LRFVVPAELRPHGLFCVRGHGRSRVTLSVRPSMRACKRLYRRAHAETATKIEARTHWRSTSMHVVVLASQKGGAGKTTLSRHLAVQAERAGEGPVVLIDADPQGGLAGWWNRRQVDTPVFFASNLDDLPHHLGQARQGGFKLVIIDTPPQATALIRSVVRLADLVLIPTRPSPDDLDAVGRTIDIVDEAKKPMVFVINGATKNARITGQAAIALSQSGTVATPMVHHSVSFPTSGIDGRTVVELDPNGNSAREITELWTYISTRLRKSAKAAAAA
jgi:chromosome partitioning protein